MKTTVLRLVKYIRKAFKDIETNYTLKLIKFIYSRKHGHEVCLMRIVGTQTFSKYAPNYILEDIKLKGFIHPDELLKIKEKSDEIQAMKNRVIIEAEDADGYIHLRQGENRFMIKAKELEDHKQFLENMKNEDTFNLGKNVGFKDGREISNQIKGVLNEEASEKRGLFKIVK